MAIPTAATPARPAPRFRRRRPYRVWPLLCLPFLGGLAGAMAHRLIHPIVQDAGTSYLNGIALDAAMGFLVGTDVMIAVAVLFGIWFVRYSKALWLALDLTIHPPAAEDFKSRGR